MCTGEPCLSPVTREKQVPAASVTNTHLHPKPSGSQVTRKTAPSSCTALSGYVRTSVSGFQAGDRGSARPRYEPQDSEVPGEAGAAAGTASRGAAASRVQDVEGARLLRNAPSAAGPWHDAAAGRDGAGPPQPWDTASPPSAWGSHSSSRDSFSRGEGQTRRRRQAHVVLGQPPPNVVRG